MDGKARATRWRAKQVEEGGKPIGVTLTPAAASALEMLQNTHHCSQRQAISLALQFAVLHPELLAGAAVNQLEAPAPAPSRRMEDLEQRLEQLEALIASLRQETSSACPETAADNKQRLIAFTARQLAEHGERMSRVQLYILAKQHDMPVPPTQHEYNVFISYHMDQIREIMRGVKERAH